MQADLSLEIVKNVLLGLMVAITVSALCLIRALDKKVRPLSHDLIILHDMDGRVPNETLKWIQNRYESLIPHVDNINTAEFSAGEIERLFVRLLGRKITVASAHGWIQQSPGILISLGLLGTFWGLTVGLGQISGALAPGATPQQTISALSAIVAPMGTAFQTSLVGLSMSLFVLIVSQLSGSRTCLDQCESLLSSWLETVIPLQIKNQIKTPLTQSISDLNVTANKLPESISYSIKDAMQLAFSDQFKTIFNASSVFTTEAQRATGQLSAIARSLNECSQDFVIAANAFRQSNFPEALKESVAGLLESKERVVVSSDALSARLKELRDSLSATESQWKLLAKSAESELQTCRLASSQITQGISQLSQTSKGLEKCVQASEVAAEQLKETRLEVMRDRMVSIEVAESVKARLAVDSTSIETCQMFAASLERMLSRWDLNYFALERLRDQFASEAISGRADDKAALEGLLKTMASLSMTLRESLSSELESAVECQKEAMKNFGIPVWNMNDAELSRAKDLSSQVLDQLLRIQSRLADYSLSVADPSAKAAGGV